MPTTRFKAPLSLCWKNECDSSCGMSDALTNAKPVSSHHAWHTDNLNVCSPLIIPFTTSLYWIIHLHTSDRDQQQKGLVCSCTLFSLGWGLITSVSWAGTEHELGVEWGLLSRWRDGFWELANAARQTRHARCFTVASLFTAMLYTFCNFSSALNLTYWQWLIEHPLKACWKICKNLCSIWFFHKFNYLVRSS